jgi:ketosteroid isomerase-like protein
MSAENVELVGALQPDASVDLVELFTQDEAWENVFGLVAPILSPEVETGFVGVGVSRSNRGLDGFRQTWVEWLEPWESYRAEIDSVADHGDKVLVMTNDFGRRRGMTAEVRLLGAAVWTVRDGKVTSAYFYANREDALDDVDRGTAILGGE